MARTVKKDLYDQKRNEILNAAQQLIYAKGYTATSVQDILNALAMSRGALYHYFDSKQAIIDALITRMAAEMRAATQPTLQDPHLSAIQKLQGFLDSSAQWKSDRKGKILGLMRMWYDERNNVVRQEFAAEIARATAQAIEPIIRQGIKEGAFTTRFPAQVSLLFAELSIGVSDQVVRLTLSADKSAKEKVPPILNAYIDVVEKMLGAAAGSLAVPVPR